MKTHTQRNRQILPIEDNARGIVFPLHTATVFAMSQPSSHDGFQYGRVGNPTRLILEHNLAKYAQADHCLTFSSGSAAIASVLMTLRAGDHLLCHNEVYEGTQRIITNHFNKFGITSTFIDCANEEKLELALKEWPQTKFIIIESPTNPLLQVLNIQKICGVAHRHQALVMVDNTFATSLLQQPLALGADIVMESLSKSINGHSDVIGGMVAVNNTILFNKVKDIVVTIGMTFSPRDAHEVLRGLKTMQLRVDKQCDNAAQIAEFLRHHRHITRVLFPDGRDNPRQQMRRSGYIISFNVRKKSATFLHRLQLITIGHSFGGVETLIQQPTTMMDLSFNQEQLRQFQIDNSFFRLSVGIENAVDVIADLGQALDF
jgi:cystathionine beta-lyase/cystathionine gamma-synthase